MSPFLGPRNFTLSSSVHDTVVGNHVRPEVRQSWASDHLVRAPEADGAWLSGRESMKPRGQLMRRGNPQVLVVSKMNNLRSTRQ